MIFVASDLEPSREHPHTPGPSLWPVGLAVGVVVFLVGFVVSRSVVVIGAVIAVVFAFLWVRELTRASAAREGAEGRARTEAAARAQAGAAACAPEVRRRPDAPLGLPRGLDARARRRHRRPRHPAGARLHGRSGLPEAGRDAPGSRAALRLPGGPVPDHDVRLEPEPGGRLEAHGVHPQQRLPRQAAELHDPLEPLRPPRLPGAAERRAAAAAERADQPEGRQALQGRLDDPGQPVGVRLPVPRRPVRHRGQPDRRPAGARPRPLLVLDRQRAPVRRGAVLGRQGGRDGRRRADPRGDLPLPGRARRRDRVLAVPDPAPHPVPLQPPPPPDGEQQADTPGADPLPARLARGALGARRRGPLLPLPQRPGRRQLVPDARLGDPDRVRGAGRDRRRPRDVLPARPDHGLPLDPAHHERRLGRLARPRHAQVGRVGVHHPDVPPHGARLPLRRLQVPARAELDHRRPPARARPRRGLHRLPAALGPDLVLGDDRRDQPERDGAVPRPVHRAVPPGRHLHQRRHAQPLLLDPHADPAGGDRRA